MRRWTYWLLYVGIGIWFSGWLQEVVYEKITRKNTSTNYFAAKVDAAPPPTCKCKMVDGKLVCTGCRRCPDTGSGTTICNKVSKAGSKPKPKPKPNPGIPPIIIVKP